MKIYFWKTKVAILLSDPHDKARWDLKLKTSNEQRQKI